MSDDAGATDLHLAELATRLGTVPTGPGVYLLKDRHGKVIYVGKALNLRNRVRTYLRGGDERSQVRFLLGKLADFETLVTASEKEALILENNLIKQYRPRYNIRLKDDKTYVSVKVTTRDPWPRVLVTRRIVKDGHRYFGPFHSAVAVRDTLDTIRKVFPLRTCSDPVFRNRTRPCIEYDIKRCLAPCILPVDRQGYQEHLDQVMLLLEGRNREVVTTLRRRMDAAADAERFEDAARLRDQLRAIEKTQQRQQVLEHDGGDQDVFGLYREGGAIEAVVLIVRGGALVAHHAYGFDDFEFPDGDIFESVLTQFYQATERDVPDEILLPTEVSDATVRAEYLSERRGRRVTVLVPQRGDKVRLIELAQANARQRFQELRAKVDEGARQTAELGHRLGLRATPTRIECVDIANFQGEENVGAVVCFVGGAPHKDGYRRFRLRSIVGTDDFAAVFEVLQRRFRGGADAPDLPDLLVIDGGLGQLGAARAALAEIGLPSLTVVALAKERVERDARATEVARRPERVFVPGRKNPIVLRSNSSALFLLQRVRDEAHRFANRFHRQRREATRMRSPLDAIGGIGPRRRRALLRRFGSLRGVRDASLDDLATVEGVTPKLAARIKAHLEVSEA